MAPKSSPEGKKARSASPEKKSPEKVPKKQKTEQEEGVEAVAASAEAPAARTRTKTGATAPAEAGKKMAAAAAAGGLPQVGIADILLGDHRDTVTLLKKFEEVEGSGDKLLLEKLTDAIAITIRLHSQAEMDVLYPVMEKKVGPKGKESSTRSIEEHTRIEWDLMQALEKRKEGGAALKQPLKEITALFLAHMQEEEHQLLPAMLKAMSAEEQVELAAAFMEAKAKAPLTPQAPAETAEEAEVAA